jgi:flagellar hook-length control protein FliK
MLHLGDIKIAQNNNLAVSSLPQSAKTGNDYSTDASFFSLLQGQVRAGEQVPSIPADRPELLKNSSAPAVSDRAPREESAMNARREETTQAIGRAEEQGQKAAAQVQGKDIKNADVKNTAEKKGLADPQGNQIEKGTDAGARTRQKQKEKKTGDADMHDLQEGLHRMIDILKGKEQPEMRAIKASAQEVHDLLRDSKMNPDRGLLKKSLDKLASLIDAFAGRTQAGKSEHLAGAMAGIKGLVKKIKPGEEKNQARRHGEAAETAAPAVKDIMAKMESLLDGVRGDGTNQKSGSHHQGNSTTFNFGAAKVDMTARQADLSEASPRNSVFRENLESIIQNARVVVKDGRNGSFSVRLHPEELGTVSINLKLREGVVQGSFLVETREARDLIAGSLDYIRQQLHDAGIMVGEFHVNVNDQRGRMLYDRSDDRSAVIAPSEQSVEIESEYMANTIPYHNGQINLVI